MTASTTSAGTSPGTAPGPPTAPPRAWVRSRVGPLVLGALPALAFPEADIAWLGFVGFVPLVLAISSAPTRREACLRAWLGGTGFFLAVYHWLLSYVGVFTVVVGPALGLFWVPWGWAVWSSTRRPPSPAGITTALVTVPAVWVAVEFARSWDRLAGPWGLLGATQWQNLDVLALASVGGVWLVSFLLMAVNVAVALAVGPRTPSTGRFLTAGCAVVVVVAGHAYGWVRDAPSTGETARIAGVQSGRVKDGGPRFEEHVRLSSALGDEDLDLVVWGESSVGFDLERHPHRLGQVEVLARSNGGDLLVNVDARRGGGGGISKSAVLVGADGVRARYDKMRLVPFGEYVPLRFLFGWTRSVTDAADEDRRRGDQLAVLDVPRAGERPLRVAPLVCFESAFPDMSRELARLGADVIVVQTSTTSFQGTWGQAQHAALSAVRAVEAGRPVVHAAMSGVSAAFDADGRRLAWFDHDETGVYRVVVPLASGRTPYVRFRDGVPWLSVIGAVVALGTAVRRERSPS